jgi:hypothetical protein
MPQISPNTTQAAPTRTGAAVGRPTSYAEHEASAQPVKLDSAYNFVFGHHETSWSVVGDDILPRLTSHPLVAGIDGVAVIEAPGQRPRYDLGGFRQVMRDQGIQIIPPDVDAPEHPSYVLSYPGERGRVYLDRWSTCWPGSSRVSHDRAAFDAWRRSLLDRGVIAPPSVLGLETLAAELERERDARMQVESRTEAAERDAAAAIAEIERKLAVVRSRIDALTSPAAPSRTKARPARGTAEVVDV